MTRSFPFPALFGRTRELRELQTAVCDHRTPAVVVTGPSGIGKTAVVDHFTASVGALRRPFQRVWTLSLYRTSWTSALADLRKQLDWVPRNATVAEIEDRLIDSCSTVPTLIVFDNADDGNVEELARFVDRWAAEAGGSSLVVTAQPQITERLPRLMHTLALDGVSSDSAILDISGELVERFSERTVLEIGRLVGGNPQKLLFLNWIAPESTDRLRALAENLEEDEDLVVEDFIDGNQIPGLFFLALGIHRNLSVDERLLARLWDHFGSGGAAAYVHARALLVQQKMLLPVGEHAFRLHESVHVRLEKALIHRVGKDSIRYFHHYFAEFYESALRAEVTTTNLTNFIYHSLAAESYSLALRPFVEGALAQELATRGAAVLVRQELEKLDMPDSLRHVPALDEVELCLRLGGVCNDLSDHTATLNYMDRATTILHRHGLDKDILHRQIWYYSAVSYSNLGQSDHCLQEYFRIVESCTDPKDELACLSLGYLAHDLKYRDITMALEIGKISVDWAEEQGLDPIRPKNMCSYAESLMISGRVSEAIAVFTAASELARESANRREEGRIETNLGFAQTLVGGADALEHLEHGKRCSSTMGDRRRMTQAILYLGVWNTLNGADGEGKRLIARAAELLRLLSDGRYFVPALCWLLQLEGYNPRFYPNTDDERALEIVTELGNPTLLSFTQNHPEFDIYHEFWWRHLSGLLVR